jgi:hypothetical protein
MGKIATAPLPDGRLQVWCIVHGGLATMWKESRDPNANFTPLEEFAWNTQGEDAASIAAGNLLDGRIQLWALTTKGNLVTTWKESVSSDADWKPWTSFALPIAGLGGTTTLIDLATGKLPDGRLQVFAVSKDGQVWTFWRSGEDWSDWQLLFS